MTNILKINSSMRNQGSQSRALTDRLAQQIGGNLIERDLAAEPVAFIDEKWINANFTPEEDRTEEQKQVLALSETLIAEIEAADTLIIGVPIYNFGVPAALKAWVDQVTRARRTFRYTDNGPEGLLTGKKAWLVITSGGTGAGSEIDFASTYMKHVLAFIGITDVEVIAADRMMMDTESLHRAEERIDAVSSLAA